jgi:hypothetical protein
MPIHDWRRVPAGIFHDFHTAWLGELRRALNGGVLPEGYYALIDQDAGEIGPDVLTLRAGQQGSSNGNAQQGAGPQGASTVTVAPPRVRFTARLEPQGRRRRDRRIVIRHVSDDRPIALIEIVSPSNKDSQNPFRAFVRKVINALNQGLHVLVIDLFPPTRRDPNGIHSAILGSLGLPPFEAPAEQPLTLVSYAATTPPTSYLEPVGVGNELPEMPLFLLPQWYVNVPLERTYRETWQGVPAIWKRALQGEGNT